jgi:hypothetical protein
MWKAVESLSYTSSDQMWASRALYAEESRYHDEVIGISDDARCDVSSWSYCAMYWQFVTAYDTE